MIVLMLVMDARKNVTGIKSCPALPRDMNIPAYIPGYRADFCFAPIIDTFARRIDFRTMVSAGFPMSRPLPPRPPLPPLLPPLRPPGLPPWSPASCSSFFSVAPARNRWLGPGLFTSPSDFGTSRIWPFTPLTCTHCVVPVFPMKLLYD
jgi:hypothetical protein